MAVAVSMAWAPKIGRITCTGAVVVTEARRYEGEDLLVLLIATHGMDVELNCVRKFGWYQTADFAESSDGPK